MITGVVKLFKEEQGFGFIRRDDGGPDVFLHARQAKDSQVAGDIQKGDKLTFEVQEGERGPRAINIARA